MPDSFQQHISWLQRDTAFTTESAGGEVEVRAAASGRTVFSARAETVVNVAPDRVVLFERDRPGANETCTSHVVQVDETGTGTRASAAVDCALIPGPDSSVIESQLALSWTAETQDGARSALLDLESGALRASDHVLDWQGGPQHVLGSGLVLERTDTGVTATDAVSGEERWSAPARESTEAWAQSGVVVLFRQADPLPLQQLYGYDAAGIDAEFSDAETGERFARARISSGWSIADGHVLFSPIGSDEWRLVGAP